MAMRLAVGTRVTRKAKNWFKDQTAPDTVTDVYPSSPKMGVLVDGWIRYAVLWDDTCEVERDYISEGLVIE